MAEELGVEKSSPEKRKLYTTWRGPRSECECGHYGDGSDTEHSNTHQQGHGRCLVSGCGCVQFVWIKFAKRFQKALGLMA